MHEAAGAGGGTAEAGLTSVLWPPTLCPSRQHAPHLCGSLLEDKTGAAAVPPHQAPGHSPPQLELRGHQSAWPHGPPLQGQAHILQAGAWSPRQGPKMESRDLFIYYDVYILRVHQASK